MYIVCRYLELDHRFFVTFFFSLFFHFFFSFLFFHYFFFSFIRILSRCSQGTYIHIIMCTLIICVLSTYACIDARAGGAVYTRIDSSDPASFLLHFFFFSLSTVHGAYTPCSEFFVYFFFFKFFFLSFFFLFFFSFLLFLFSTL